MMQALDLIWRPLFGVGKIIASNGTFDVTAERMAGAVKAFGMASSKGRYPDLKFDHAGGEEAIGLGKLLAMEVREDGQCWGGFKFIAPIGHEEYADFVERTEAAFRAGTIDGASIEAYFNVRNATYYGTWVAPMTVEAVAILPSGVQPAWPAAGHVDDVTLVAGAGNSFQDHVTFCATFAGREEGAEVEEIKAMLEALGVRVGGIEAKFEAKEKAEADKVEAARLEAEAKAKTDAKAANAADAEATVAIEARIVKVLDRIQAGKRDGVKAKLSKASDNAAKSLVLDVLEEGLSDEDLPIEKVHASAGQVDDENTEATPAGLAIAEIAKRDGLNLSKPEDRAKATFKAMDENPEAFSIPVKKGE